MLKRLVGAAIPESALLTLRVCTMLLKKGVAAGLSLRSIGYLITGEPGEDGDSPLHVVVMNALERFSYQAATQNRLNSSNGFKLGQLGMSARSITCATTLDSVDRRPTIDDDRLESMLTSPLSMKILLDEIAISVDILVHSTAMASIAL